jgi:hypothetical protein
VTLTGKDDTGDSFKVNTAGEVPVLPSGFVTSPMEMDGPADVAVNTTFSSTGVVAPSPLKVARYCTNREVGFGDKVVPEAGSGTKSGQVLGFGSFPNRALRLRVVPLGTKAFHATLSQVSDACASMTREVKMLDVGYGPTRIHFTATDPPSRAASETRSRRGWGSGID